MALPWVKLHIGLIDNDVFKRLSKAARLTFFSAIPLAAKLDLGGVLALRNGPMTVEEIAYYTGLSRTQQAQALQELVAAEFLHQGLDGAYAVDRWSEKAGFESSRKTNAERQRKYRMSQNGLSEELWQAVLKHQNNCCGMCGADDPLTIDHYMPTSRGGSKHIDNIWALCRPCNSRKHDKTPDEFLAFEETNVKLLGKPSCATSLAALHEALKRNAPTMRDEGALRYKTTLEKDKDRDNYLVRFAHSGIAPKNVTLGPLREDDPAWARELAAAFAELHRIQLRNLTPEQRIVVGRFFAAICSNCNRDEKVNKTKGLAAAHSIAKMGVGRSDDMTALQFAKYAWKTLELRGWKPFYKPFDIDLAVKYKVPA